MRKIIVLLCLFFAFTACKDETNENETNPIEDIVLPSNDTPILAGKSVTIHGKGFTQSDEIWLKVTSKATSNTDLQASVTEVTATFITFTVPTSLNGTFEIILRRNGKSYSLGSLCFQAYQPKFYTFCYDDGIDELAEIDIETGNLIWHGLKIFNYGTNSRGYVFDDISNELITFGDDNDWVINRLDIKTKGVITLYLKNLQGAENLDDIIRSNDNKYYTFCYDDNKNELAEIDIETGNLIWNGLIIPNYGSNSRGYVFDDSRNEFITFGDDNDWVLNRLNMKTKKVITLYLKNLQGAQNLDNIIKSNDNKFYTFCYDDNISELAEIDIETGNLIWNGLKIPNYGSNSRGYVFDDTRNEFISLSYNNGWVLNRLNMKTKEVITLNLKNPQGDINLDLDDIISF